MKREAWMTAQVSRAWAVGAASLVAVMGCSKLLEIYLAPM